MSLKTSHQRRRNNLAILWKWNGMEYSALLLSILVKIIETKRPLSPYVANFLVNPFHIYPIHSNLKSNPKNTDPSPQPPISIISLYHHHHSSIGTRSPRIKSMGRRMHGRHRRIHHRLPHHHMRRLLYMGIQRNLRRELHTRRRRIDGNARGDQ
jgi:hypothetical protein